MKKTLTINLSGIVFNIDEDAFIVLKSYLDTIRGYFKTSEGRDEIMTDIESRIAEMLQEKLHGGKQVINSTDISEIISIMGQPEDYITEDLDDEPSRGYSNPRSTTYSHSKRRLYRDTDESVIGGVASGIAYYFGIDPLWIRLVFVIAVFAGFSGILIYIILWIIMPEARTPSEKLAMKGEPVTFENIGKTVEDEINNVKKKLNNLDQDHIRKHRDSIHGFVGNVADFILSVFKFALKAVGKILGFLFIIIGGILLISLLFGTFAPINNVFFDSNDVVVGYNLMELSNVFFASGTDFWIALMGSIFLIGIPFLALLLAGFTLLFNIKIPKYTGLAMAGAWVLGLILTTIGGVSTAVDFAKESSFTEVVTINNTQNDTLYLDILDHQKMTSNQKTKHVYNEFFKLRDGILTIDGIDVDIVPSNGYQTEFEIVKTARGNSFESADKRASKIDFKFEQDSNHLKIDPYFSFNINDTWRNQEVQLNVFLPVGKTVYIPKSYKYLLDDVDNYTNTNDKYMVEHFWTMTDSGLVCPSITQKEEISIHKTTITDIDEKLELKIIDGEEEHSVVISTH